MYQRRQCHLQQMFQPFGSNTVYLSNRFYFIIKCKLNSNPAEEFYEKFVFAFDTVAAEDIDQSKGQRGRNLNEKSPISQLSINKRLQSN